MTFAAAAQVAGADTDGSGGTAAPGEAGEARPEAEAEAGGGGNPARGHYFLMFGALLQSLRSAGVQHLPKFSIRVVTAPAA